MLQAGTTIGQVFSVLECIGEGGGGSVYRCLQAELNREVAVKLLHPSLLANKEARDRFSREAKILATLQHPNIAKFFQWGMDDNITPYIAMEFIAGKSLQDCLVDNGGRISWQQACTYTIQMCAGLNEIHSRQIVHRDVKPGNFMLTSEGTIKLVDFGLAKSSGAQTLTDTGLLVGSIHFMSPEACRGQKVDHRTDIYALGCALYSMIYGEPPFQSDAAVALLHKHSNELPHFAQTTFDVPSTLVDIMRKCLEKNPDQRYQSALELGRDLKTVLDTPGQAYRATTRSQGARTKRAWITGGLIASAIALCCIIAAGLRTTVSPPSPDSKSKQTASNFLSPHRIKEKAKRATTLSGVVRIMSDGYLSKEVKIAVLNEVAKPETGLSNLSRGAACYWLGQIDDTRAVMLQRQALELLLKGLEGETTSETCSAKELVAHIYLSIRDYANAEKYLIEALKDSVDFGPTTPVRINCYKLYLQLCLDTGRMKDAMHWADELEQALIQKHQVQVSQTPQAFLTADGAAIHNNQIALAEAAKAECCRLAGNIKQASEHALLSAKYSNPSADPDYLLSAIICQKSSSKAAEVMFKNGSSLRYEIGRVCTIHLAYRLADQGRYAEAKELLEQIAPHLNSIENRRCVALYQAVSARCNRADGMNAEEAFAPLLNLSSSPRHDAASVEALILAGAYLKEHPNEGVTPDMIRKALEQPNVHLPDILRTKLLIQILLDAGLPRQALLACSKVAKVYWSEPDPSIALLKARALGECGLDEDALKLITNVRKNMPPNAKLTPVPYCELLMLEAQYCKSGTTDAIDLLRKTNNVYLNNGLVWYPSRVTLLKHLSKLCTKEHLHDEAASCEREANSITSQTREMSMSAGDS